ncbi:MAG: DUF11 domain-containing protein [Thermomicrobiales bacterium]
MTDGTLTCEWDEIASGASEIVNISGTTDPADCGTVENTATVDASNLPVVDEEQPNYRIASNLSSTDSITVLCPDLLIEKTALADPINAGDQIGFTIEVTNNGLGSAYDVVVLDTLPSGIAWNVSDQTHCSITNGELRCEWDEIAAGGKATVTITGPTDAEDCGLVSNTATVDASNLPAATEENSANRESTDTVQINCSDLTIVKTGDQESVNAGDQLSFTITITNNGAGTAYDVVMTDVLPSQIGWDPVSDPACSVTNGTLTCEWDEIASGASETVTIVGHTDPEDCGVVENTATVDASNLEPYVDLVDEVSEPLSSTDSILVLCPDLEIEKVADQDSVNAGDKISFTITITNNGPGAAYDVVMTDALPANIDWDEDRTKPAR